MAKVVSKNPRGRGRGPQRLVLSVGEESRRYNWTIRSAVRVWRRLLMGVENSVIRPKIGLVTTVRGGTHLSFASMQVLGQHHYSNSGGA